MRIKSHGMGVERERFKVRLEVLFGEGDDFDVMG
jgi:hypothetical protein